MAAAAAFALASSAFFASAFFASSAFLAASAAFFFAAASWAFGLFATAGGYQRSKNWKGDLEPGVPRVTTPTKSGAGASSARMAT